MIISKMETFNTITTQLKLIRNECGGIREGWLVLNFRLFVAFVLLLVYVLM